ncbi:unnamed protein product [Musa banksii]
MPGVGCTFQRSIAVRRLTTSNRGGATAFIGSRRDTPGESSFLEYEIMQTSYMSKQNEKLTWQTTQIPEDRTPIQDQILHLRYVPSAPTLKPQANTSADISIFVSPICYQVIKQKADDQCPFFKRYDMVMFKAINKQITYYGFFVMISPLTRVFRCCPMLLLSY